MNPVMRPRRALVAQYVDDGDSYDTGVADEERVAAFGQQRNDDMRIPDITWKNAAEEQRVQLRDLRSKIKAQSQATKEANSTNKNQITQQCRNEKAEHQVETVAKAQRALASALDSSDSADKDPAVAQLGDIDHKMRSAFGFMTRTSIDD
jgi:hypothetical protein